MKGRCKIICFKYNLNFKNIPPQYTHPSLTPLATIRSPGTDDDFPAFSVTEISQRLHWEYQ